MMKSLRLPRPFYLSLLAIAGLLFLSYFPLAKIRAANAGATILPSAGKALVNLNNPQNLKLTYAGSADAVAALQGGTANPTALVAADFDADGAMDVVAGYSTKNGGVLVLMRGNPDAYAPTDLSLYAKAMQGNVPPTFLPKARVFAVPESPDLLVTGDFNRDGYKDVLVAARGGALYLLAGDGRGNLLTPNAVPLTGQVMALAATADGHVAVSLDGASGPELVILSPSSSGLIAGATYPLPARGDSVAWGNLGGGADLAVGAGTNVVVIYSALSANAQTESVNLPFNVQALALGDFIWDRDGRTEISVLADDGTIHILQHGTLDTTPVTAADLPARRAALRVHHTKPATAPNPTALGAWTLAKRLPYTGSAPSGPVSSSAFNSPRLASSSTQDLMVLDAGRSQLHILDTSGKTASPSADISFSGTPVAALALPQKINASRDIVVLTSSQSAPTLITSNGTLTLNVNTTADIDTINACTTSTTSVPSTLSLREAVCLANNSAPDTTTINLPSGTYDLTSLETGELQIGNATTGFSLSMVGTGTAANTIIQQTDGVDRILEEDFYFGSGVGNNPLSISNVTLTGGNCTNTTTNDCEYGGGAIVAGGNLGDDLTLTNVVFHNNSADAAGGANGGAVDDEGPNLTVTNTTFSSNSAPINQGGALFYQEAAVTLGGEVVTNSTFTNNTAGQGGALYVNPYTDTPSIFGYATISGSSFTGNTANGTPPFFPYGGAIYAESYEGTITISNSRFADNHAEYGSGFALESTATGVAVNNWWGCNAGPGTPANDGPSEGSGGTGSPINPGSPNAGCDTIFVDTFNSATVSYNPWLVLSISANPTQIDSGGTSTLTADLTHNSNGTGGFSVPNGTPVSFGGTLDSSVNPTGTTLTSGQATSTYTAGSSPGNGTGTATVDNQQVSTPVDILVSVTVTTSPANLLITVDGTSYTAPQSFNWVVGSSHTIATTSPQTGPSGTQYVFSSWSDSGTQSHSVTAPTSETTYTANFNTQYQLTTGVNPAGGGTVTPTSGGFYNSGASVPLTATANAGYSFVNWTGNVASSTSASTSITMTAPQSVTANFSLIIVAAPTTTSVSSNNDPSFTAPPGNSVTFTATVTSNTTVNEGTVTFSDQANDFTCSGGNTVPVSNGQAACTTSFSTEVSENITATYNGTVNFQTGSGFITQTVNNHTVVTGNQFCNQGAITIPSTAGAATPYPSNIFVTGLSGNVGAVTVNLNNISSSNIQQTDLLLVGPTGAKIIPFASVGDGSSISGVNITLDDSASGLIPGGSPLTSGSYQPTSITGSTSLVFPAPAPLLNASNYAATDGAATLTSTFQNTAPNGTWALYAMDHSGSGAASIGGGWCVNITPPTTQITVGTSPSGLSFTVDGTAYTSTQTFTWIIGSMHTLVTTSPQGTAGTQYLFSSWSNGGAISQTVTAPPTATTYTAAFSTQYQLTTATNPGNGGTVSPTSGTFYSSGTIVPLTATPKAGFTFSSWTGKVANPTSASTTITMNAAESVTANFTSTPVVLLSPTSVNFGEVYLSPGMRSKNVTLKNAGTSALLISNVSLTLGGGTNPGEFGFNNLCPAKLGVEKTCTIAVSFSAEDVGSPSATLNIADNASGSPQQVSLSATVINPLASYNPKSRMLGFGKVALGNQSMKNVVLTNTGTTALDIASIGVTGADQGDFGQTNNCPSSLAPTLDCTISVTFTPSATGERTASITVTDNAQVSTQNILLSGQGIQ